MELTLKTNQEKAIQEIDKTLDREWTKSTFLLTDNEFENLDSNYKWIKINRYKSSADYKFTSSRPGLNIAVNPKPQFTRYCDIRSRGKLNRPKVKVMQTDLGPYGLGMGRYYSEAIDDNQQRIFLRFGVPKYNLLSFWVADAFDVKRAIFMNRGTISTYILKAVDLTSIMFRIVYFPLLSIGAFILGALVSNSRFYTVKPTMYLYWATVEDILNSFVSKRTMLPHILSSWSSRIDNKINQEITISESFVSDLNKLIPDIVDSRGRISVFGIALKAQAAFNRIWQKDIEQNDAESFSTVFENYRLKKDETSHDTYFTNKEGELNFASRIFRYASKLFLTDEPSEQEETPDGSTIVKTTIEVDEFLKDSETNSPIDTSSAFSKDVDDTAQKIEELKIENVKKKKDRFDKYKEYLLAELTDGAAFAVFNVEYTGSVGESFSNSFSSNPLSTVFNSISSKVRNISSYANSLLDIPVLGDILKVPLDAGAIVINNASFGIASPLLALFYGIDVEMPKIWESSSASLPRTSYKIKLISPYGNPYSQLFNIYLPLSMILAGSLPRATGSSSHTSPFLCQLFDRGRVNISLGMIDSVSITRGTSNLAFSRAGHPNSIDVDISVTNMDEIISVDIASEGLFFNDIEKIKHLSKSTPFTDYINTITALDVFSQIYTLPKIRLALAEVVLKLNKYIEPDTAAFAAFTVDKIPGMGALKNILLSGNVRSISDLTQGFDNPTKKII